MIWRHAAVLFSLAPPQDGLIQSAGALLVDQQHAQRHASTSSTSDYEQVLPRLGRSPSALAATSVM